MAGLLFLFAILLADDGIPGVDSGVDEMDGVLLMDEGVCCDAECTVGVVTTGTTRGVDIAGVFWLDCGGLGVLRRAGVAGSGFCEAVNFSILSANNTSKSAR